MGGYDVLTSDISQANLLAKTFLFSSCLPLKRIMQIELVECQYTQQGADILQLPRNPRTKILPNGGLLMLMETSHPKKVGSGSWDKTVLGFFIAPYFGSGQDFG